MSDSLTPIRVIKDPPASGSWNMAVDQAILESIGEREQPTLRIYFWRPATLSLGYFQTFDERKNHTESFDCPVVRRSSGGGAIMHDQEITYSLTMPSTNRWASRNTEIYSVVHDSIVSVLAGYSVSALSFVKDVDPEPESPHSFLCFQRRHAGDLICKQYKVVGSAQRRSKQAVLQHGSILLETSPYAPQLPGIFELANVSFDRSDFVDHLIKEIASAFRFEPHLGKLSQSETTLAESVEKQKFASDQWNLFRKKLK